MHWWKQHLGCHALVKGATPKLSRDPNFVVDEAIWFSSFFSSHNGSKLVILARLTVTKVADFCLLFIHTYLTYHHYSPLPFEKIHFFQPKKIFKKKSNFFLLTAESSNKFFYIFWSLWKNKYPLLIRNWKFVNLCQFHNWDKFFPPFEWVSPKVFQSKENIGSFGMRIRYPRCLKMLVGRWVPATGRHISRSRRTTSTYFENGSRTHTQKTYSQLSSTKECVCV